MKPELTNPHKILFPEQGITKLELAEYYAQIQSYILPFVMCRPLTLVRCPQGRKKTCFYQKHLTDNAPEFLYGINIKEKIAEREYIYLKNIKGLIALVQMGVLEIHTWNTMIRHLEKPDLIIFDLDPAPGIAWKKIVKTARLLKSELQNYHLRAFVKTTGGKGLHIVVPIKPQHEWLIVKNFSHEIVKFLVRKYPKDYIATMSKLQREGKIFIDYFRNQRGATSIAPYSTRAKVNAPIATPVHWDELDDIQPNQFNIRNIFERLSTLREDPWQDFTKIKQILPISKEVTT